MPLKGKEPKSFKILKNMNKSQIKWFLKIKNRKFIEFQKMWIEN